MHTIYNPYPMEGALGSVGLGALTYPSWIPQTCKNCSASTLARWKVQVAFAMGWYDIFRNLEKFPTAAQAGRLKRFGSYKPEFLWDPNNKFWTSTPERAADHAAIAKQATRHGSFHSSTSFDPFGATKKAFDDTIGKIPVVGDAVNIAIDVATAPIKIAADVASGARLDHVALNAFKDQLRIVKETAPYAASVVSFVPGIGTGAAAAIAAGAALAEGQSITEIGKAAIRGAIPGGALAQVAFDTAVRAAAGENVGLAALASARALVPAGPAQTAFDIGVAVATGEKIQTALARGLMNMAPGQLQTVLAVGRQAIAATSGLATAFKNVAAGQAAEGFTLAAGLLGHKGLNEKALTAVRSQLPAEVRQGFDTALKTQIAHLPWLKNVTGAAVSSTHSAASAAITAIPVRQLKTLDPPKKAPVLAPPKMRDPPKAVALAPPKMLDPPKKKAMTAPATSSALAYGPYPQGGALGSFWASDEKWRWFTVRDANGAPLVQRGPVWLSDQNARLEEIGLLESTQTHGYIGSVARWDWNADARQWGTVRSGALSGPAPECLKWGDPVADMTGQMRHAGLTATQRGPRVVLGPDGGNYLFQRENGTLTARRCIS